MRRLGFIAVILLLTLPAIAIAASNTQPKPGKWKVIGSSTPKGSFTITKNRKDLKSFKLVVVSSEGDGTCPSGTITVAGPLPLRRFSRGGVTDWGFGIDTGASGAGIAQKSVRARLNGSNLAGAAMEVLFDGRGAVASNHDADYAQFWAGTNCYFLFYAKR